MGLFDRIHVNCPHCGSVVEFQSKEGECSMEVFSPENAPTPILYDTMNDPVRCGKCGNWCALHDPAYPPDYKRPRPQLQVVKVVAPEKPDTNGHGTFWWPEDDEPFSLRHIQQPQ